MLISREIVRQRRCRRLATEYTGVDVTGLLAGHYSVLSSAVCPLGAPVKNMVVQHACKRGIIGWDFTDNII